MLLQTNSYIVPKEQRAAHARLLKEFRATMARLGCDDFEVYEQAGTNWSTTESTGRFVQIMRFRDRGHQLAVRAAERSDKEAQALIAEFCELINFPYQQEHGYFAVGFYTTALKDDVLETAEAPAELGSADASSEAYLDQDLDEVIEAFGAPTMRLATDESEPVGEVHPEPHPEETHAASENGDAAHPDIHEPAHDLEPAPEREHGHEAEEHPASPESDEHSLGQSIGEVLDPALMEDELDTPMEAELIEEVEEEPPSRQTPANRAGRHQ